jgi:hypothetical protein
MSDEPRPTGLTILGRGGLRLVSDRVRSFEWESYPRREPKKGEGAVGASQADKSSIQTVPHFMLA